MYISCISQVYQVYIRYISGLSYVNIRYISDVSWVNVLLVYHRHILNVGLVYFRPKPGLSLIYLIGIYEGFVRCNLGMSQAYPKHQTCLRHISFKSQEYKRIYQANLVQVLGMFQGYLRKCKANHSHNRHTSGIP